MLGRLSGLRVRMVAGFCAVALLSSVLASGLAYVLVRRAILQRTQDAVLTEVRETVARTVPPELPPDSSGTLSADLERTLTSRDGRIMAYVPLLPLGREVEVPLLQEGEPLLHVPVTQQFARRAVQGMVFQRVVHKGRPYLLVGAHVSGYRTTVDEPQRTTPPIVFVSVSLQREEADLRSFTRAVAIADAMALAAAFALALLATRGVLRPVRRLGNAARALGDGRLETRLRVRGRDELADLARTFNGTAEALERTVTELRAMEAASRRFVADVSHELRTPLTAMIAVTDVLAEEGGASPAGGTAARLIVEEVRRLGVLVENLIEISRFDSGAASLVPDDLVVAEAVAASLAARGWSGQMAVRGPDDLIARLDPRRFDVIIANLVGNALRHGAQPVRLDFRPAAQANRPGFELTVTDRGPGIPDDLLALVFDRFVKAEAARTRSEGSGLGLSIARENALLHGGNLTAANSAAGGAVFTLWLTAVCCLLVLTGCGIRPTGIISAGDNPVIETRDVWVTVYLVSGRGRLVPVVRPGLPGHPYHAITQLGTPPTSLEQRRGLRNAVPTPNIWPRVEGGENTLAVNVDGKVPWPRVARAQIVCTAQTVAGIRQVMLIGLKNRKGDGWATYTCGQFTDLLEGAGPAERSGAPSTPAPILTSSSPEPRSRHDDVRIGEVARPR
jgi:signal transduction histidine kinase